MFTCQSGLHTWYFESDAQKCCSKQWQRIIVRYDLGDEMLPGDNVVSHFGYRWVALEGKEKMTTKANEEEKKPSINLRGRDLRGRDLRDMDLKRRDLRGTDLQGANMQDCDLRGTDLREANLQSCILQGAKMQDCDLRGANMQGADLRGTDLQGCRLCNVNFNGVLIKVADRTVRVIFDYIREEDL